MSTATKAKEIREALQESSDAFQKFIDKVEDGRAQMAIRHTAAKHGLTL